MKSIANDRPATLRIPVGSRLKALLKVACQARRAVLLEGPTGVGKSESCEFGCLWGRKVQLRSLA